MGGQANADIYMCVEDPTKCGIWADGRNQIKVSVYYKISTSYGMGDVTVSLLTYSTPPNPPPNVDYPDLNDACLGGWRYTDEAGPDVAGQTCSDGQGSSYPQLGIGSGYKCKVFYISHAYADADDIAAVPGTLNPLQIAAKVDWGGGSADTTSANYPSGSDKRTVIIQMMDGEPRFAINKLELTDAQSLNTIVANGVSEISVTVIYDIYNVAGGTQRSVIDAASAKVSLVRFNTNKDEPTDLNMVPGWHYSRDGVENGIEDPYDGNSTQSDCNGVFVSYTGTTLQFYVWHDKSGTTDSVQIGVNVVYPFNQKYNNNKPWQWSTCAGSNSVACQLIFTEGSI